jgi:hypothetical protein
MAITKETVVETIRIVGKWNIEIATDTVIKEDGSEISRSRHRHCIVPFVSTYLSETVDGVEKPVLDSKGKKKWTHTETDISGETKEVQAIATALWTDSIKTAYKADKEEKSI